MAKAEAKLDKAGVRAVLRGQGDAAGVTAAVRRSLERIAAAAGPGHSVRVRVGRNRVRGTVTTSSLKARRNQARDRTLTRALDAGRQ